MTIAIALVLISFSSFLQAQAQSIIVFVMISLITGLFLGCLLNRLLRLTRFVFHRLSYLSVIIASLLPFEIIQSGTLLLAPMPLPYSLVLCDAISIHHSSCRHHLIMLLIRILIDLQSPVL